MPYQNENERKMKMNAEQLELPNIINPRLEDWKLKIFYDDCCDNPREWCNIGEILCFPNRYLKSELPLSDSYDEKFRYSRSFKEIEDMLDKLGYIHERICVYDHSGVRVYLGSPCCQWDSGYVGWYCVSRERIREEYGVKRVSKNLLKKVREVMESEINTYSNWLEGNVFGFELYKNGELIDSCSGFIADYMDEAIKDMIEHLTPEFTNSFSEQEILNMTEKSW